MMTHFKLYLVPPSPYQLKNKSELKLSGSAREQL